MRPRNICPDAPKHADDGLQPERTSLAWGRTVMGMIVAAAVFLRWIPHHGWMAGALVAATLATAMVLAFSQPRRYRRAVLGIGREQHRAGVFAPIFVSATVITLGMLGISAVLLTPMDG